MSEIVFKHTETVTQYEMGVEPSNGTLGMFIKQLTGELEDTQKFRELLYNDLTDRLPLKLNNSLRVLTPKNYSTNTRSISVRVTLIVDHNGDRFIPGGSGWLRNEYNVEHTDINVPSVTEFMSDSLIAFITTLCAGVKDET